jgi:tellurite resistance protein TerC
MDWSIVVIILQLIFLEGILSIDNAAVLGAMVTPLPSDKAIPWPDGTGRFAHYLDPLLGHQRMAALRVGLLGAYLGRGLMLLLVSLVIHNPWIKILGALYLIRLAFEDLSEHAESGQDEETQVQSVKSTSFWSVVLMVELMDLVFSIDNVVAAVSLSDKLWVVMVGVAIGILTMRFAAGLFSYLVEHEPVLYKAAYILVLNIGIELLLEEIWKVEISDWTRFGISVSTILLALIYGRLKFLHRPLRPLLIWISQGFGYLNNIINWLLVPLIAIFKLLWKGIRQLIPAHSSAK